MSLRRLVWSILLMAEKRRFEGIKVEALALLGGGLLGALQSTWRWSLGGTLSADVDFWSGENPRIFAFWHNRQLMMPAIHRKLAGPKHNVATLISRHSDGRIVSRAVRYLGLDSVAGSSSRGAATGLRGMLRKLSEGSHVAITPDGPRGPIYKAKDGPIKLASLSGLAIYPLGVSANRAWRFSSWDRMLLPKPFAKMVIVMGEPFKVPRELSESDLARWTEELEQRLVKVTNEADEYEFC